MSSGPEVAGISFLTARGSRDFEDVVTLLTELRQMLQELVPESILPPKTNLFLPLRKLNDSLYEFLPTFYRALAGT
jgi:hypothetical protein